MEKSSIDEGVAAGDGEDVVQPPSLLEEIITVRHDVDNNCPPAAFASSAFLHSMYDVHVIKVFDFSHSSVLSL